MKIKHIDKLNNSIRINIEPTICNNALVDDPHSPYNTFTDNIDLFIIENYNEHLHSNVNFDSLKSLDISNVDLGDEIIIEGVKCKVAVIFDGYISCEATSLGAHKVNFDDYNDDYIPF